MAMIIRGTDWHGACAADRWTVTPIAPLELKARLFSNLDLSPSRPYFAIRMAVDPGGDVHLAYATQAELGHAVHRGARWSRQAVYQTRSDPSCDALVEMYRAGWQRPSGPKPADVWHFGQALPRGCYPRTVLWGIHGLVADEEGVHLLYRQRSFTLEESIEEDRWQHVYRLLPYDAL